MKKSVFLCLCDVYALSLFLFIGCSPRLNQPVDTTVTTTPSLVPTMTKTRAPISTLTPIPTATPTITKTPLPMNTLTAQERESYVREFLTGDPKCELPCWLGITPGETTWNEAEQILRYFGVRIGATLLDDQATVFHGTGGFDFEEKDIYNGFGFGERAEHIDFILITSHGYNNIQEFQTLWKNYSPEILMKTFGIPDQVVLNITIPGPSPYRGYFLWLFYEQLGFMVRYDGGVLDAPIFHICPKIDQNGDIDTIKLSLQSHDSPFPLGYFDPILTDTNPSTAYLRVFHSIHDATGMDEKEFYDIFVKEEPACFNTQRDLWNVK